MKINIRLTTLIILTLMFQFSFSQKISKKEAKQLLEKTLTCLKNNDTTSFANLWYLDNTGRPYDNSLFTKRDVMEEFNELKVFLDSALKTNMALDEVWVEKFDSFAKYKVKYKIKGWFKYDPKLNYYIGFGVLVDYIDDKWVFRFTFEHSTAYRS